MEAREIVEVWSRYLAEVEKVPMEVVLNDLSLAIQSFDSSPFAGKLAKELVAGGLEKEVVVSKLICVFLGVVISAKKKLKRYKDETPRYIS